jgi:hypothetical protein
MFAVVIFVPSLIVAALVVAYYGQYPMFEIANQVYYWVRIGSILFNIIIHCLISYKLNAMGFQHTDRKSGSGSFSTHRDDPVRVLASRIKYYPIVQIVSRAGAAWYELAYGFDTDSYSADLSLTQTISLYFYGICVPTAGIGYFLVFLIVQPAAYEHLMKAFRHVYRRVFCCTCCYDDDSRNTQSRDSFSTPVLFGGSAKMSLPLLHTVDYNDLDEDELSHHIDSRYTKSADASAISGAASSGVYSYNFREAQSSNESGSSRTRL